MKTNTITTKTKRGISLILVFGMIFSGIAFPAAFSEEARHPSIAVRTPESVVPGKPYEGGTVVVTLPNPESEDSEFRLGHRGDFEFLLENKPLLISDVIVSHPPLWETRVSHPPVFGHGKSHPDQTTPIPGNGVLPDKGYCEIIDVNPKPEIVGHPGDNQRFTGNSVMAFETVVISEEKPKVDPKETRRKRLERYHLMEQLVRDQKNNQVSHNPSDDTASKMLSR